MPQSKTKRKRGWLCHHYVWVNHFKISSALGIIGIAGPADRQAINPRFSQRLCAFLTYGRVIAQVYS
jgi:hypothetical protein